MVNNLLCKCLECGEEVLTKTTIGHENYVEFAFPCPGCEIELRFGMNLDQKKAGIEYVNFCNIKPEYKNFDALSHPNIIKFDSSFLIPKDCPSMFSPFIMSRVMNVSDDAFVEIIEIQKKRLIYLRELGPIIQKMEVHTKSSNYKLFNKNLRILGINQEVKTEKEKLISYLNICEDYYSIFIPTKLDSNQQVYNHINKLLSSSKLEPLKIKLIEFFIDNERGKYLFRQVQSIRKNWRERIANILIPLYHSLYDENLKLEDYLLCQKRFEELKDFYKDCFETFCRISVFTAAIEGVVTSNSLCVPKKNGIINVEDFEIMDNGSKKDILKNLSIGYLFIDFIDPVLRNGVGHNSAHYNIVTDSIEYRNQSKKRGIEDFTITYNEFCKKALRLYIQLENVSPYIHWLLQESYIINKRNLLK